MPRRFFWMLIGVLLLGCPPGGPLDFDGDGAIDEADCGPEDPAIHPDADDPVGDGVDSDCDGVDGVDSDGDGSLLDSGGGEDDCNDADAAIHPGAAEVPDNEIDEDCDGIALLCDADGDGWVTDLARCPSEKTAVDCLDTSPQCWLDTHCVDQDGDGVWPCLGDCDDNSSARAPFQPELCDGLDGNCDFVVPADEIDSDGDGVRACDGDCAPADGTRSPQAPELCNAIDDDCDGAVPADETDSDGDGSLACADCDDADASRSAEDADSDGTSSCAGDCDDAVATTRPGAIDVPDDGVDQDCSGADLICDGDGDGSLRVSCGGADCDDANAVRSESATEVCNGLDDDCDGAVPSTENDDDGDGFSECEGDCDDFDDTAAPGGQESCDGVDNDCQGGPGPAEVDADGDDYLACAECADSDPARSPEAIEACNGLDDDCDGVPLPSEVDGDSDGSLACAECDDDNASVETADLDGDGVSTCDGDCDDGDAGVYPGAPDFPLDGAIPDCDGFDGIDADGDGFAGLDFAGPIPPALQALLDCDDDNASANLSDADGDGSTTCAGDCDDADPAREALNGDGDGRTTCAGDCDDTDSAVRPGLAEACDGLDTDCDGALDPGDADADGDGGRACTDCDDDNGILDSLDIDGDLHSTCAGDCDDGEPAAWPGAPEACDGVLDNDCDGQIDSTDQDNDSDGETPCEGDCDDADPRRSSTLLELCDAADNDCDGFVPLDEVADTDGDGAVTCADCDFNHPEVTGAECVLTAGLDVGAIRATTSQSNLGASVVALPDVTGDGAPELLVGATAANITQGQVLLYELPLLGILGPQHAWATLVGEDDGDAFGRTVTPVADVTGDGALDLLVGAARRPLDGAPGLHGAAYLLDGRLPPGVSQVSEATALATFHGEFDDDHVGDALVDLGDFDGDGFDDLGIGAYRSRRIAGGNKPGVAYVMKGGALSGRYVLPGGLRSSGDDVDLALWGTDDLDRVGVQLAALDFDCDGIPDLAVGAESEGSGDPGAVYVIFGAAGLEGHHTLRDLTSGEAFVVRGELSPSSGQGTDGVGVFVGSAGDLDGDGCDDLLVGAKDVAYSHRGSGFIVHGPAGNPGAPPGSTSILALATTRIQGGAVDRLGWTMAPAGDLDGDGVGDVLVSAFGAEPPVYAPPPDMGVIWAIPGTTTGTHSASSVALSATYGRGSPATGLGVGGIAPLGDLDGDGLLEFALGSYQEDFDKGAVYQVYGWALQ